MIHTRKQQRFCCQTSNKAFTKTGQGKIQDPRLKNCVIKDTAILTVKTVLAEEPPDDGFFPNHTSEQRKLFEQYPQKFPKGRGKKYKGQLAERNGRSD